MRPGYLSIAAATAIPDVSTQPDPNVPGGAYLVDDERLTEILDELGDFLRVLRFIENPSHPSFSLQLSSSLFDAFQGSAGDELLSIRERGRDANRVNRSHLSASS